MSASLLVLIPTYNEEENIVPIIRRVRASVPDASILVIDDASPDGTAAVVEKAFSQDAAVAVLHRGQKEGLGPAYLAGFDYGFEHDYELIAELDADGSHDPDDLPRLLAAISAGADLAIGARWIPGGSVPDWGAPRRFISSFGNRYARFMLRSSLHDLTAGFRIFRTAVLRQLQLSTVASHGYGFQVELAWRTERAGFKVAEVPVVFRDRTRGKSKMHLGIVVEALWRVTLWGLGFKRG